MNLMKTLTIGAAALGWLTFAGQAPIGQANAASSSGSSSREAKYAAATKYESGGRSSQKWGAHRSASGRSAYAPRGAESRCTAKGGRLVQERGGDWRCVIRGGRSVYAPRGKGRDIYHERGVRGGRSVYQPHSGHSIDMKKRGSSSDLRGGRTGAQGRSATEGRSVQSPKGAPIGTHGLAPHSDIPSKSSGGRSGASQGSQPSR